MTRSPQSRKKRFSWSPPLAIAAAYLCFSAAWIIFSDNLVQTYTLRPETYTRLQHYKGLLFVALSAGLLFLLTRYYYLRLRARYRENKGLLARYELLHRATQEAIVDYDFASDTAVVNDTMTRLMNVQGPEISGFRERYLARVQSVDRDRVRYQLEHLEEHGANWISRFRFHAGSNGYRSMRVQGTVLRDDAHPGRARVVFAMSDETEVLDARAKLLYQQVQNRQEQSEQVIAAEERERERWAHELHDNVCQLLTAAGLSLAQTEGPDPMQVRARELVARSLNEIRQLSAAIRPPEFAEDTLVEALESLSGNINRLVQFNISLQVDEGLEGRLAPGQKLMVYRIVQEQLNNVLKYSGATQVQVRAALGDDEVRILVADNGKGFDPDAVTTGIGLRNIRSRLQVFSGTLDLQSAPGAGCTLEAVFPL